MPVEALERFESPADDGSGGEQPATDIDRMDGETDITDQEGSDRPMASGRSVSFGGADPKRGSFRRRLESAG
ncbi:hypothetical protein [Nonomuraea rhodomycinica]|uniref:Uncharacterized protein n=1 Tax=Nonomuraea rhodomycinica TaxID=1712872 RepID=A0A7Y6IXX1_9ACTN|nr:hypothetical protein [Nonomuraea rhodomycinica]NUW46048.1 hypothetical protein [Nonomuraea rhodomycinica]